MSLHRFHIIFVLFALVCILLLSFFIEHLLQQNIDDNVENGIKAEAVEISEQLQNNFETIRQKFALYEKTSLKKIEVVQEDLLRSGGKSDLDALAKKINADLLDGRYEIYVINAQKVVERSSNPAYIGFDFKSFPYYAQLLEQLKTGSKTYQVSLASVDNAAMQLNKYYFVRGSGDYWVAIGYVLPIAAYAKRNIASLYKSHASLRNIDIFMVTPEYIQQVNRDAGAAVNTQRMIAHDTQAAAMIFKDLGLPACTEYVNCRALFAKFKDETLFYLPRGGAELQSVYALSSRTPETFLLLARMAFDPKAFEEAYASLKNLLYLFILLMFTFTVLSFVLMYNAVILKITDITRQMRTDEPIVLGGYLFSEFRYLVLRYNNFLLRWKEEVHRLKDITMMDELTQSFNRRYFNLKMQKQIELFRRYEQGFSMIMFDIDDFKQINDRYGHDVGDRVLCSIVEEVKKQIRSSDLLCRIGGEEFAVILPAAPLENACIVAEKIRSAVAAQSYAEGERVTVSLGVEAFDAHYEFNSFYSAVDTLLYKSKSNGKNRVYGNCRK